MKARNLKLICLLLETVGIFALFLPFYFEGSPWIVLAVFVRHLGSEVSGGLPPNPFMPLALPAFLAVFIWLQTLRSLFRKPLTKPELWLCIALVVLLMLVPLVWWLTDHELRDEAGWSLLALLFGLALFAAGLLLMLKCRGVASQFLAPLALRCAYLPNAVFCLLLFSNGGRYWNDLHAGAACVGVTVVLYLAEIVYLTRQGLTTRPGPATRQAR
jgi:hypothetical protein